MEARPAQSVAGRCLDGPYPKGARKRRRCSTPDAPVTPGGSINPDHPDHSPPAAGSWGGGGASAALEVPPQAAPLFAPAPRPAWPSDDESRYRQAVVVCIPALIATLLTAAWGSPQRLDAVAALRGFHDALWAAGEGSASDGPSVAGARLWAATRKSCSTALENAELLATLLQEPGADMHAAFLTTFLDPAATRRLLASMRGGGPAHSLGTGETCPKCQHRPCAFFRSEPLVRHDNFAADAISRGAEEGLVVEQ